MRKRKIQGRARYCAGEGRTRRRDRKDEKRKKCVKGYGNSQPLAETSQTEMRRMMNRTRKTHKPKGKIEHTHTHRQAASGFRLHVSREGEGEGGGSR